MDDHKTPADEVAEQAAGAALRDGHPAGQADGQGQPLHREEFFELVEHVVVRLQNTGGVRLAAARVAGLRKQAKAEPRWPVSATVIVAIVLQAVLSNKLALQPGWLIPALEGALLIALVAANPLRIERMSGPIRAASVALIARR
jgi:hypothetical protein